MSFWFGVLEGLVLGAVLVGLVGFTAFRVGCALAPDRRTSWSGSWSPDWSASPAGWRSSRSWD